MRAADGLGIHGQQFRHFGDIALLIVKVAENQSLPRREQACGDLQFLHMAVLDP